MSPGPLVSPIVVVGAPGNGETIVADALARAGGLWRPRPGAAPFPDAVEGLDAASRGYDSHRLTADDAQRDGTAEAARASLAEALIDREGRAASEADGAVRPLLWGPRLSLRIPFVDALAPDARFVLVHREPADALADAIAAWRSERFVSVPGLPGWDGPPWSLPLVPGWRELAGASLEELAAAQWRVIAETMLADLGPLEPQRWCVVDRAALLADPRGALQRLCAFLEVEYDQALLSPVEGARRAEAARAAQPVPEELAAVLPRVAQPAARIAELIADQAPSRGARPATAEPEAALRSVHTGSFPGFVKRTGGSLLISTYQTGRLICARERDRMLNTHFRAFDKPMGLAVHDGRFALGTRTEVWDFRDMPEVAPKVEPPGTHDACYLPRNRHTTGDIAIHEMAFVQGELWLVATAFSCLATINPHHSFVPRWKPPFITELQPGDRCHLNGMAVRDDRVTYVSALGTGDEPGSWREGKATGGVILDVDSGETVAAGLSMPHSPKWHNERLWVLESGKGELCTVDLETGETTTVVELPGFTRGMAFHGRMAFVGLSQIRESSTFGDLPLTQRLSERQAGVWVVDTGNGTIAGFLRFEDLVQEVFDVAILPGHRWPEIAEPGSTAASTSFALP